MSLMSVTFHSLLWVCRILGLMPCSEIRWIKVVSRFFCGFHVLVNILLIVLMINFAQYQLEKYSGQFFVYVGFGLHVICVVAYIINIVEGFIHCRQQSRAFQNLYELANESSKRFSDKLFKLKLKSILVPFLFTLLGVWIYGAVNFFGCEVLSFLYHNAFMFLRNIQFNMLADGIRIKLEILNEDLEDLLKTKRANDKFSCEKVRREMVKIRCDYQKLKDLSNCVNNSTAWSMLMLALLFGCFLICTSYWLFTILFKDVDMLTPLEMICYISALMLAMAVSVHPCTECQGLSSQIGYNIHKLQKFGEDPAVITQLATEITDNPIVFTCAGYFPINFGFFASILATAVTYLMILLSFDKDQGQMLVNGTLKYNRTH